jgi:hypothetical protein
MELTANGFKMKKEPQAPAVRIAAKFFSYLFHPIFIPVYIGWFVIFELRLFHEATAWDRTKLLIMFVMYYTFFPLVVTLLLKALNFIESIHLKTQRDRIIPYVICEIFYFWGWYVFRNMGNTPREVVMLSLAIFLATSLGLILNAYLKISMHAIAVGVLSAFVIMAGMMTGISFGVYISIAFLIAGITLTSRFIDSDHTQAEIYLGFFSGVVMLLIAYLFS